MSRFKEPPIFIAKFPYKHTITKWVVNWIIRRYFNTERYQIIRRFSGPRPRGTSQISTTKSNATHLRVYVKDKWNPRRDDYVDAIIPHNINKVYRHLLRR